MNLLAAATLLVLSLGAAKADPTPRCAIMETYLHSDDPTECSGDPDAKKIKLPCLSGPGSPCISDHNAAPGISVKDLYCDEDGFHETGYRGSETCEGGQSFPVDILKGKCFGGTIKFISCDPGDCEEEEGDDNKSEEVEGSDHATKSLLAFASNFPEEVVQ